MILQTPMLLSSNRGMLTHTTTSLRKVIWEEGRVAALSDTGRFDNEGESGRRKTESLLRRTSLYCYCELSQHM